MSLLHCLNALPALTSVCDRKFFYIIFANAFIYAFLSWQLNGGGAYDISQSIFALCVKNIITNASLLFPLFYLINLFPRLFLTWLLVGVMFLIACVDTFLIAHFHTFVNAVFVDIFFSSNPNEAREFLTFYGRQNIWVIALFILCSGIFLFAPYEKILNIFKSHTKSNVKANSLSKAFALCVCIICLLGAGFKLYRVYSEQSIMVYLISKSSYMRWGDSIANTINNQSHIAQYKELSKNYNAFLQESQGAIAATRTFPNIVLIIGESTQKNYMSLYNYPLPTTPKLQKLQESGNLIVFSDVISPHSHTNQVLEKVLTFKNYENNQTPWFKQQNLIDILKLAGYKTHWLSNQEVISIYGNAPEVISTRADITRFATINDSYTNETYDEILLPLFDNMQDIKSQAKSTDSKNTYIFHLMGTHLHYIHRYPKAFDVFTPQDLISHNLHTLAPYPAISNTLLNNAQLRTKTEYLNAILYNDYVVSEIIERFKESDSIVIYLSDHGDEVYDFRDFAGHTESMGSRFMIEVPFMIYMSESFKSHYPEIVKKVQEAKDKPFMSDDFIHAFLDLFDISAQDSIQSRSLFSKDYNDKRMRIFSGKDYDKDLKHDNLLNQSGMYPSKIWLHRVDEIQKFMDFKDKYAGFEIDVYFLESPTPYFDVGHDGEKSSINLKLEDMFEAMQNSGFSLGGGGMI